MQQGRIEPAIYLGKKMTKYLTASICLIMGFLSLPATAFAQQADEYHPFFTRDLEVGVGAFFMNKELTLRVDGSDPGDNIEFDEVAKLDDEDVSGALSFRWRFGEKWGFWAQGWKVSDSGGAVLTEDVEWEDVVFQEDTFAKAGFDLAIARLFFGRKFWERPNQEFGVGVGAHWMEFDAFMEGQILTDKGDTEFHRGRVEAEFPLPNLGAWYAGSWSPKWMFMARVDWLDVSIGDYSGGLWNSQAGVHWQTFDHVGIGFYYSGFILNADAKKSNWRGKVETDQHGPLISILASW